MVVLLLICIKVSDLGRLTADRSSARSCLRVVLSPRHFQPFISLSLLMLVPLMGVEGGGL